MTYALIVAGTIQTIGGLPAAARRLDTGEWVCPVDGAWTPDEIAECGYVQVVGVARPADTPTATHDYSVTLVEGVPTETWTQRPKTQAEIDSATRGAARDTLMQQLASGVLTIQTVRAAAAADIDVAEAQRSGAVALKGAATTQKGQVQAFAAPATYSAATITTIRDALVAVIARQELIIQAVADLAGYRKANDESTLVTDDSLLWLARLVSGVITD